ncbi:hypothetical protein GRI34_04905 [Erythrobacter aquimaris]|uniref:Uncharacterized protein n=1 Tax=Qipengyuania aquimaris TaxID=255984 RepID=A0A6I4TKI3_9SPHN|nr:hypothetical protein [Qipengyuania aquimaris]MXO95759.1 hypothetical protein [Qipengyuania aquimaris]
MPDDRNEPGEPNEGDVMAGDRRIARADTALPDWYASDAAYRPIPIAWFAGALVLQVVAQPASVMLFWGLFGLPRLAVVAIALLISGMIWQFTRERGMSGAGRPWQWATGLMLAFFFGITALSMLG